MSLGDAASLNNQKKKQQQRIACDVSTCAFNDNKSCSTPELVKVNKDHRCVNFTKRPPKAKEAKK